MLKRVFLTVMVLVLLVAQAMPAVAGDDEWGVAGFAAEQALEGVQVQSQAALMTSMTQLPLYFVENQGQVDERVGYYVQGKDKTLYFTSQGLTFVLSGEHDQSWVLKLDFLGADPDVQPEGQDETSAVVSYFKGRPEEWVTGLKTYSRVVYRGLWPGIDLEYTGTVNQLKYQFVVQPGADPSQIKLAYRGADMAINEAGQLEVSTPGGGFEDGAPYAYQGVAGGEQVEVAVSYELEETLGVSQTPRVYGFRVGAYDASRVLVLDPVVLFSCGYIGGNLADIAWSIAVDSEGNAYVTGETLSTETSFPDTVGPDRTHNGNYDVFVAKVRAGGGSLAYCGYIGGSGNDYGKGIAVDGSGCAYVTGFTYSTQATFPVIVGPDLSHNLNEDAFVAKVSADGTTLNYCGYIGGRSEDVASSIAVDALGQAYVTGDTSSDEVTEFFPVTVGPDLSYNGEDYDAFVAKVHANGTGLVYCGYIGGDSYDHAYDIAVDSLGNAYVTGDTYSDQGTFPVATGPDTTHNGRNDAFVAKVRADGIGLTYCGYIGGSDADIGYGIAVDSSGRAYVTGSSDSDYAAGFPLLTGPDLSFAGVLDAFVAGVHADGTGLIYCGYIGGGDLDRGRDIAVDSEGSAYVVGQTKSTEAQGFPVVAGPDLSHNGSWDAFVAKVQPDGTWFDYCSYIGGANDDNGYSIALEQVGVDHTAHVVGCTSSSQSDGFPVAVGPDLSYNGGDDDAFVARIGPNHAPTLGTIDPANGSSAPGTPFFVTTSWIDIDGWRDLKHVYFHIGDSPSLAGNVTLMYNRAKNKLWIRNDDGTAWQGGCSPTEMAMIANSQATVYCQWTQVTSSGTDTMNVTWYMWFMPGYEGAKKTGLKCKDMHQGKAKGKWKGTWTIE